MQNLYLFYIRILVFIVLNLAFLNKVSAQESNIITDGFSDGDFTKNPEWFADPKDWFINSDYKLQSVKKDSSGKSFITTNLPLADLYTWTFNVNINTKPSVNNNAIIYLVASDKNLLNKPSGYFIEISSTKEIKLRERSKIGGNALTICSLQVDLTNGINNEIKVLYNENKKWILKFKNGDNYDSIESTEPSQEFITGNYFGFLINYSTTNTDKYIFNDISIEYISKPIDPNPPKPPDTDEETPIYKYNDLIINEILFNHRPSGVPFVEIYNKSDKNINLKYLKIATLKDDGKIKSAKSISKNDLILIPNNYLVLTKSKDTLTNEYYCPNTDNIFELSLPLITVTSGTLALLQNETIIDKVSYNENMHYPLLNNFKGVSLERINFDAPSNLASSFHSASSDIGFATPGYKNSQFIDNTTDSKNNFKLSTKLLEPGVSGVNNILEISYNMQDNSYSANINIFDDRGKLIKNICNNQLLGVKGSYFWDGLDNNNKQVQQGIYIIKIKAHNIKGNVKHFIDAFAVTYKHL